MMSGAMLPCSDVSECRRFGIKLEPSRKPASNPWTRNIDSRGTLAGKISKCRDGVSRAAHVGPLNAGLLPFNM